MPNEWFTIPDSDPDPSSSLSPRAETWVRARLQREFPGLSAEALAAAIRNAAALMHPRKRRGVILSAARICLIPEVPGAGLVPEPEIQAPADAPLVALLQRCLPAVEEPPDAGRFNREIFARLWAADEGAC